MKIVPYKCQIFLQFKYLVLNVNAWTNTIRNFIVKEGGPSLS